MRRCLLVCSLLLMTTLSACGTFLGRRNADYIGAYPGEAIVFDFAMIASPFREDASTSATDTHAEMNALYGLVSLPFDLVVDVVLLPADLIGWLFGLQKSWAIC